MAGADEAHVTVAGNLFALLRNQVAEGGQLVLASLDFHCPMTAVYEDVVLD